VTNRGVEINERITSQRVRLIDAEGVQKGVVSIRDALWQLGSGEDCGSKPARL
jgi:translation initiation factor IF-3